MVWHKQIIADWMLKIAWQILVTDWQMVFMLWQKRIIAWQKEKMASIILLTC